jgi:hypothetical protein
MEEAKEIIEETSTSTEKKLARRRVESSVRRFTDFKILRLIGAGTFGKVYLGLLDGVP